MRMRTRTVRWLTLSAIAIVTVVGGTIAFTVVRGYQRGRANAEFRAQGLAALERGDYFDALGKTGSYLKRSADARERDAEAVLAYARSRSRIEEVDGSHLTDGAKYFVTYLGLRPDDTAVKRELLDIYIRAARYPEARDLAISLRPEDLSKATAEHVPVLREEAKALYGSNVRGDRLQRVLDRLFQLEPLDLDANIVRLDQLFQSGDRAAARNHAQALLEAHKNDLRAKLIAALARLQNATPDDISVATEMLIDAAGLDGSARRVREVKYADEGTARRLVDALDGVGAFTHARVVLEDAAPQFQGVELRRMLARRLWQDEMHDEVLKRFGTLDPADIRSDSETLGFVALSNLATGKPEPAATIAKALATRGGDPRGQAFKTIIELSLPGVERKPLDIIQPLRDAVRGNGGEPLLHTLLGEALAALGRNDEALAAWKSATEVRDSAGVVVGRSWNVPLVRTAELLLADGRAVEAARSASRALFIAPGQVRANIVFFETQAARILVNSDEGPKPAVLLERLEQMDKALGGIDAAQAEPFRQRLVPTRVLLLSRLGRADEAKSIGRAAIAGGKLTADSLRRLAAVSSVENLGIETAAVDRAESQFGQSADVLYSKASEQAARGEEAAALESLRKGVAENPTDVGFYVALARFLEGRSAADATKAWADIVDKFPGNVFSLRAALGSPSVSQDAKLLDRTVQSFQKATGRDLGEDVVVRTARARSLLQNNPTQADRDKAVAMLSDVVQSSPMLLEPRVLLAAALAMDVPGRGIQPDYGRAITQLNQALASDPRSAEVRLELGRLEQIRGNAPVAREQLNRVASDSTNSPDTRRRAAELLINQGDVAPVAIATLEELASAQGDRAAPSILVPLAECYRVRNDTAKARQTWEKIVARSSDIETLYLAARFYAAAGDDKAAESVVARMASVDQRPWIRPFAQARLAAERGDNSRAAALYEECAKASPEAPAIWQNYADFMIRRGRLDDAVAIAERGLKAIPGDPPLVLIREQARMLLSPDLDVDLGPLIKALGNSPEHATTKQMLEVINQARVRGDLNTSEKLTQLVDRFPGSTPLLMFAARKLEPLDPGQAVSMAMRAMQAAPSDPAPARLAAEINLRLARWNELLSAAQEWRSRDRSLSPEPDLAIAEAYANLGQAARGLESLRPRLQAAIDSPTEPLSLGILNIYARLLVDSGRESEARELLRPLAKQHAIVRGAVWINLASRFVKSFDVAKSWLDELRTLTPEPSAEEGLQLVTGLNTLATRFPDRATSLNSETTAILDRLASEPRTAIAPVFEFRGMLRHRDNDLAGAETNYRRALELDPKRVNSLNNLADIALGRGALEEARKLALQAVDASANNPAPLDTLGSVYARMADDREKASDYAEARKLYAAAAETYRSVSQLLPADHVPLGRFAYFSDRAGDDKAAEWAYDRLLSMKSYPAVYIANTRNNLSLVLLRLNRNPADASRALLLATEAARAEPGNLAFQDTLGWAQLRSGQREAVVATFRGVLKSANAADPATLLLRQSSTIGLATALADGSPTEKQEAGTLLDSLKGQALPPDLESRAAAARSRLAR